MRTVVMKLPKKEGPPRPGFQLRLPPFGSLGFDFPFCAEPFFTGLGDTGAIERQYTL